MKKEEVLKRNLKNKEKKKKRMKKDEKIFDK